MRKTAQSVTKGFTLVELLVVIAILGIITAVVVLVMNPAQILAESRDATRLSDLANIQQAINVSQQQDTPPALCQATDMADADCLGDGTTCAYSSLTGIANYCYAGANNRNSNGTGWVRTNISTGTVSMKTLPVDPSNTGAYYYRYQAANPVTGDRTYELNANLESTKHAAKEGSDGGNSATWYEVGTNLTLMGD